MDILLFLMSRFACVVVFRPDVIIIEADGTIKQKDYQVAEVGIV